MKANRKMTQTDLSNIDHTILQHAIRTVFTLNKSDLKELMS